MICVPIDGDLWAKWFWWVRRLFVAQQSDCRHFLTNLWSKSQSRHVIFLTIFIFFWCSDLPLIRSSWLLSIVCTEYQGGSGSPSAKSAAPLPQHPHISLSATFHNSPHKYKMKIQNTIKYKNCGFHIAQAMPLLPADNRKKDHLSPNRWRSHLAVTLLQSSNQSGTKFNETNWKHLKPSKSALEPPSPSSHTPHLYFSFTHNNLTFKTTQNSPD